MIDKSASSVTSLFMVLAVVVMAALAYSVSQDSTDTDRELLAPELAGQLNNIQSVRISGAGNTLIAELKQSASDANEGTWVVSNAGNYSADVGALRKLLLTLAEASKIEEKTSNPDYYERLGVADIEAPDASGVRIDIEGLELPAPSSFIIGNTRISGDNSYVRRADDVTSWLVSGVLEPSTQTHEWLNRNIVELTADRISTVKITHPDGETLELSKETVETPAFTLVDMPAGRELSYQGVLNTITGAPTNLQLDDVVAADSFDLSDIEPVIARFSSYDGLILEIAVYHREGQSFLQVSASSTIVDTEADTEAEAQAINARTNGWLYQVAEYKAEPLQNHIEDLLKQPE